MKSLLLTALLFFTSTNLTGVDTTVYICESPIAYAYHKTANCSALKKSKYPTKSVSLEKAIEMHRPPAAFAISKKDKIDERVNK